MKKYVLMICVERDMWCMGVFDTKDGAWEIMKTDFLETICVEDVEIENKYATDDNSWEINPDGAWATDICGQNYDWKIVEV